MDTQKVNSAAENRSAGLEVGLFLRIVWLNRFWIGGTVLGAMVVAAVASLVVEKTYQASGKIQLKNKIETCPTLSCGRPSFCSCSPVG